MNVTVVGVQASGMIPGEEFPETTRALDLEPPSPSLGRPLSPTGGEGRVRGQRAGGRFIKTRQQPIKRQCFWPRLNPGAMHSAIDVQKYFH
jgi:hypothetical protein